MRHFASVCFGLWLAIGQSSLAISPEKMSLPFREEILACQPDSLISAIVHLKEQADISALDRQLYETRASRAARHAIVIDALRAAAENSQEEFLTALDDFRDRSEVRGYTAYWITNCVVVQATARTLMEFSDRDDIQWLEKNFKARLIQPVPIKGPQRGRHLDDNHGVPRGIRAIGAPRVWYELGITGAGRLVGNLDTGVDATHPAVSARWRGHFAPAGQCWHDPIYGNSFPRDLYGHGTHVMGTMCGNSLTTNDSVGVAPEALWIASNAIDQDVGPQIDNDILEAFQWFADPDNDPSTIEDVPDVIQNSWGVDGRWEGYEDCFNLWNNVIINCEAAGIVVVFSAGNEGSSPQTCRSPATVAIDSVTMFAVGAVDATNDTIPPYEIASFSSRGPSDCPPYTDIKPEVCAPGVDVYSSIPDNRYDWYSGTSMAGPHVAGIVALMRQALPDAEVRDIKSILMRTAHDYGPAGEDNAYGFGFVDAYEAVLEISVNRGFVQGTVLDDSTDQAIQGAVVEVIQTGHGTQTNSNGFYRISLLGDSTWTLHYGAFGYLSQEHELTVAIGETTALDVQLTPAPFGILVGSIVAGDSIPVEGAAVSFPGTPLPTLETDSLGAFQIHMPGDATYELSASYYDAACETTLFVATDETTEVVLYLDSPRSLPVGPDAYGYLSYDRFDHGNAAVFDWMEISPSLGGSGTIVSLPARDSSGFTSVPFPLYFYGRVFDSLTINENGWLSPGISHDHSFFNFTIPGSQGPSGMLAPFWDNLHDGADGEICYFYDSLNCRFVVEYNNFQYLPPSSAHLTFQAQIYSSEARPTSTGDCEVVYLYKRLDIPDASTVGIEDPTEAIGLQLLLNGDLNSHSWPIQPGAAVLLTTRSLPISYGALAGQIITHPEVPDLSAAVIRVGCGEIHPNESGEFIVDSLLTGLHRPEVFFSGYELGRAEVVISADSTSEIAFELWRLDAPWGLEASCQNSVASLRWHPPASIQGVHPLDALQTYALYRNDSLVATPVDTSFNDSLSASGTYDYFVLALYDGGTSDSSNHAQVQVTSGTEETMPHLPQSFELSSCFPNPFNMVTTIAFALPRASNVRITIYDVLGRQTACLADGNYPAGYHHLQWNAEKAGTGLYFIRMETDEFRQVRKVLLLR
jgi:subtilisin family serine protease